MIDLRPAETQMPDNSILQDRSCMCKQQDSSRLASVLEASHGKGRLVIATLVVILLLQHQQQQQVKHSPLRTAQLLQTARKICRTV